MDPNKPESLKQKLDRYQKTLDYVNEVQFAKLSPPESKQHLASSLETAYIPGRRIAEINKDITEGNLAAVRDVLKTLSEIDPANSKLNALLNKQNVSAQEMLEAAQEAISRHALLQDARNNLSLAEEKERQAAASIQPQTPEEEPEVDENQSPVQRQEEEQHQSQESQGQEQPSGQQSTSLPTRTTPTIRHPLTNRERFGNKEAYSKYKEDNQEERKKRAKDLWDRRKAGLLRPGAAKASSFNPLGDWLAKKAGQRIVQSRIGQAVARNLVDPLKQAIANSRAWQAVAPRLQPLANAFSRIASPFRAVGNALGAPERWLNAQTSNLARMAGNGIRSGLGQATRGIGNQISNIFNAAKPVATQLEAGAAGVGTGLTVAGELTLAVITSAAFWWVAAIVGLFIYAFWYNSFLSNSGCEKPGEMKVKKVLVNPSSGQEGVKNGAQIDYLIEINYVWLCEAKTLPTVTITDTVPTTLEYVENSAESQSGAFGPGPKGTYNPGNRTINWTLTNVSSNDPVDMAFSVKPTQQADGSWSVQDTWLQNQAIVTYQDPSSAGDISSSGDDISSAGGFPPTKDNCNGVYQLINPLGNFGDPQCNFKKDDLYNLLKQIDTRNADFWFYQVVRCESGYNPNSWRDPNIAPHTPDPAGAWGLYQMGRGRNGQYDHGDVNWELQTTNAVKYAQSVPSIASYWACAR